MRSPLPDVRSERIASYLAHQRTYILSTAASQCVWAMPGWYRSHNMEIDCLVPRWADVTHHLVQDSRVLLVVQTSSVAGLPWFQI